MFWGDFGDGGVEKEEEGRGKLKEEAERGVRDGNVGTASFLSRRHRMDLAGDKRSERE